MYQKLGLIGCGLMGGSFALALKKAGLVAQVVGYSSTDATLDAALQLGVIDARAANAAEAVQGADLVLVAVPVAATAATFSAIAATLDPNCLLMDVGSTKQDVIAVAHDALGAKRHCFVPAHPITGKESAGVAHSEATLYQSKRVILTPSADTDDGKMAQAQDLWQSLGAEVIRMPADEHDRVFAAVSHLPHLLSFALVNSIAAQAEGASYLQLAGSGFRDSTRIAASPVAVWRDILHANREAVQAQINHFKAELAAFEAELADSEQLTKRIARASQIRAAMHFDKPYQKDETSS